MAPSSDAAGAFKKCLESNKQWCSKLKAEKPDYLPTMSKGQAPSILWIGCSDSRVPPETITGFEPGQIFVHRNIANVLTPTDLSSVAVIEFACQALKVQHIVLCGHSGCGGVAGAMGNKKIGKIDTWLMPLRNIRMTHLKELESLSSDEERSKKMVELNVQHGIEVLRQNPDVVQAQKDRGLEIHGVIYDIASGELIDVDVTDELGSARKTAFETS